MASVLTPPHGSHPPGSFTKNYGWSGKGFLRLHEAIRAGFSGALAPVERSDWRSAAKLPDTNFLLTANFFLNNVQQGGKNIIPVDEFVRQAVMEPHSQAFDRLALFVLNLSLGGKRAGSANGVEFPAPWANQFVREQLWKDGRWQRDALEEPIMDAFISSHVTAVAEARIKCRTNYRYMFELVKYLPTSNPEINTDAESWIAGALFTAWDRRAIALGSAAVALSPSALVTACEEAEDYKLLGITIDEFHTLARPVAEQYAAADGINRFSAAGLPAAAGAPKPTVGSVVPAKSPGTSSTKPPLITPSITPPTPGAPTPPEDLGWLTAAGSDAAVDREISKRLAQKRDHVLAVKLKELYKHECMACGNALIIGLDPERRHAESAHIKPLGFPHSGPDKPGNMIVLCPGHHIQFDRGILSLRSSSTGIAFVSRIKGDPVNRKLITLHPDHQLDADCVNWHATMFSTVGK